MGTPVQFLANGHKTEGCLGQPASGTGPGMIVIQEWWGLVPHIEDVVDRLAAAGFFALTPDLYHGERATSPDAAGKLMMSLQIESAAQDLEGAIRFLAEQPGVSSPSVGIIGFCMGGALALHTACRQLSLGACVVFYGIHPNVVPDLPNLHAPVLGIFAEDDTMVTPATVADLDHTLSELGKRHALHTYPGTRHAFLNDTRPDVYDAGAAQDAWRTTLDFVHTELRA